MAPRSKRMKVKAAGLLRPSLGSHTTSLPLHPVGQRKMVNPDWKGGEIDFTSSWGSSSPMAVGQCERIERIMKLSSQKISIRISLCLPTSSHPCATIYHLISFKKLGVLCSKRGCIREGRKQLNAERKNESQGFMFWRTKPKTKEHRQDVGKKHLELAPPEPG